MRADVQAFADSISDGVGQKLAMTDSGDKIPPVTCIVQHPLEPSHLAAYAAGHGDLPTEKADERDINVLRARHHSVARYLAAGLPEGLVAELTNFTPSYLSTLKKSPAVIQLIQHYRMPGMAAAALSQERLRTAADGALERLIAKLETGKLSSQEELALAKLGYDRSGVGPASKIEVETTHTDVAEVQRLHQNARANDAARMTSVEDARRMLPDLRKPDAPAS